MYTPRDFDHFAWRFASIDGFVIWVIIRVDVSFLMMTASRSRYSLLYFPLLGFIPLCFPAFLWFTAAFNRHFRADFRLYYGI